MLHAMLLLGVFLTAWGAVFSLSPWMVGFCRRQGLVVDISERDSHSLPTPHGGGLLLVAVAVPLGLAVVWGSSIPFKLFLTVMLLASLLVAWDGWRDDKDRHAVNQLSRLLVQLVAVGAGIVVLPPLFDFMPLWLEKALLMLSWAWFVNLFNFMNGADGFAETEAVFLGLSLAFLVPPLAPLGLVIAGVSLGFLRVNWHPARLFLGDVGSTWLGYVLGGFLFVSLVDDTWTYLWPMASLPLLFWADATSTLIRRVLHGHKPWEPHKTFWFHRCLTLLGGRHDRLVYALLVGDSCLFVLAWLDLAFAWKGLSLFGGVAFFALVAYTIQRFEMRKMKGKSRDVV